MTDFQSKKVPLSNLLKENIQTGFQVREQESSAFYNTKETPPHQSKFYKLIQVKDTSRGVLFQINPVGLNSITLPARKSKFMQKYLIQKDDVLYLSKLHPGAFRYKGPVEDTIPMAHFYILRPKSLVVDPDYLCWALNQGFIIKRYLQKHLIGSALPFIPRSALVKFPVPLPPLHTQKSIVQLLQLRAREKEIQKTIEEKKSILINSALRQLL